jgi:XTP/dITP diphosphohydrolase
MKKLILASGNKGKLLEFQNLFAPLQIEVIAQTQLGLDSPEETGLTFIENAILKARYAAAKTGLPALADDSGLAVDALNGHPGIYSARYASMDSAAGASDGDNIEKLMGALQGVPMAERQAQFHCVLALMMHEHDPTPLVAHGVWHGHIAESRGGNNGFGYDPVFWLEQLGLTAAELSREQKSSLSHRGSAMKQLMPLLQTALAQHS